MTTQLDNTILKTVPSVALVNVNLSRKPTRGIRRLVNLAVMNSILYLEDSQEIQLYPIEGAMMSIKDPDSIKELLSAIASYTVQTV
jgi:hypothetical protein